MTKNTKIEWADHTFNPWWGCTKISPACDNCYAAALDKRTGGDHWGANQPRKRTSAKNWLEPVKWNRQAEAFFAEHGHRQRVFCASMADVFDNEIDPQWRYELMSLIDATPNIDWLILTKRIGNANAMLFEASSQEQIPANIWLGATICNQEEADRDIPKLLAVPTAKRFLSIEPMLGAINLTDVPMPESGHGHHEFSPIITGNALKRANWQKPKVDWVICGGESGHGARPMHPDWARSLRDQCAAAGVPFMFKQWGNFIPSEDVPSHLAHYNDVKNKAKGAHVGSSAMANRTLFTNVGKKNAGRLLDGVEHNGAL